MRWDALATISPRTAARACARRALRALLRPASLVLFDGRTDGPTGSGLDRLEERIDRTRAEGR